MESRSALILYASVTGNAQEGAEELARMMTRLRFNVRACEFDEVEIVRLRDAGGFPY